jgi:hypothetical protein
MIDHSDEPKDSLGCQPTTQKAAHNEFPVLPYRQSLLES